MAKVKTVLAVLVTSAFLGSPALAAFSMEELVEATKVALGEFKKGNAEHVSHFVGYKVWKSGEDSKAKIYVNHDGMSMDFDYMCHKHGALIECHAQ